MADPKTVCDISLIDETSFENDFFQCPVREIHNETFEFLGDESKLPKIEIAYDIANAKTTRNADSTNQGNDYGVGTMAKR